MKLEKISENVNRSFVNGTKTETVSNARYEVLNNKNERVGSAEISNTSLSVHLSLGGFSGIEDGEALLTALFNETPEEPEETEE